MERTYSNRFEDRIETDQSLDLTFDKRSSGSLVIFLDHNPGHLDICLKADQYSYVKIFIQNRTEDQLDLKLHIDVEDDAKIELGLLDLQDKPVHIEAKGELNRQGATLELYTAQLCLFDKEKKAKIDVNSNVDHTYGNMHNFAVVFDGGKYEMVASGRIVKGAYGSESHQETRVLTMGKDHKCVAIPILYIDENEVKASHALTIGQPDAQQLYYLQSRGLNTRQAIGLLSIGYFKPVISLIDDQALRDEIEQETESRVGMYEY